MNPFNDAPKSYTEALNRFAGLNPYGRPNWRVCIAEHVTCIRGGVLLTWPSGKKEAIRRVEGYKFEQNDIRPTHIEEGVFEMQRWPVQGWIVERWMPAHYWGARQWWEDQKAANGQPMMGPYPEEGDYWMLNGPFEKIPALGDVEQSIGMYEKQRRDTPVNLELEVRRLMREQEDREMKAYEDLVAALEQFRRSEIEPVLRSTSLSAQAVRQQTQAALGLKSHAGVQ